jgi:tRNA pseudouridine55 synthase
LATGLLPLTFGEATKFSQTLLDADKAYTATVLLGITTTTADADGEVLARHPVAASDADIARALDALRGDIEQVPPMYSALKHHGRPLYEYARDGIEIPREARMVRIERLDWRRVDGERLILEVECSKGTYVRTLASDLGTLLGCGAHLTALRRTRIGPFALDRAISLADFEALPGEERAAQLAPVDALLAHLPVSTLDALQCDTFIHGQAAEGLAGTPGTVWRAYAGGRFLGLGTLDERGALVPTRLVATGKH